MDPRSRQIVAISGSRYRKSHGCFFLRWIQGFSSSGEMITGKGSQVQSVSKRGINSTLRAYGLSFL